MKDKLTIKQMNFARFIFEGHTQREAWGMAGYSTKYPVAWVDSHACTLANQAKIQARVNELQAQVDAQSVGTVLERTKRLTEIYRANLTDFVDQDGNIILKPSAAIAEYVVEEWKGGEDQRASSRTKRIKLHNPIPAIAEHNKMDRVYDESPKTYNDNRQINIIVESKEDGDALKWLREGGRRGLREG